MAAMITAITTIRIIHIWKNEIKTTHLAMEIRSAFYNFVKPDVSNWYPHFLEIIQQKEH